MLGWKKPENPEDFRQTLEHRRLNPAPAAIKLVHYATDPLPGHPSESCASLFRRYKANRYGSLFFLVFSARRFLD
jgi:hypothetical protein